jgi:hypothetical protein
MGLFDYIVCEVPLPDGFTGELHTKDLGCYLLTHIITKDGRLMLEHVDRSDEVLETRTTSRRDANFDGTLRFYGSRDREDNTWEWHEYSAKFVHGQLVSIERDMRKTDGRFGRLRHLTADDGDRLLWACV